MLIATLIVGSVAVAILARLALLRWTGCRSWSFARTVITWAVVVSATGSMVLLVTCLRAWIAQNGFALRGICPAGPPDIPARPCTVSEFAANSILSPFAAPANGAIVLVWALLWCVVWCVSSAFERCPAGRSRLRHVLRAFAAGASAWLLAIVMTLLTAVVAVKVSLASPRSSPPVLTERDLLRAWALPVRLEKLEQKNVYRPNAEGVFSAFVAVPEGDAVRALRRWPKHCWQSPSALPEWLFRTGAAWPGVRDRAPSLAFVDRAAPDVAVAVGIRVYPSEHSASPSWSGSFGEAHQKLQAGGIAWEWFAIAVEAKSDRNRIEVHQRGYERDMRGWRPICQSDGKAVDSIVNRPVLHGSLRGVVQHERAPGVRRRRKPIASATLSFEHENGFVRKQITSAADGTYRVTLPVGLYYVAVRHPAHQPYTTQPGGVRITQGDGDHFFRIVLKPNKP